MTKRARLFGLLMAIVMLVCSFSAPVSVQAASTSPKTVYSKIQKAYGTKFPLKSGSSALSSSELGVSKKWFSSAYGRQKGTDTKYVVYIAKTSSSANAKKIQNALKTYVNNGSHSMYISSKGKKLYKNAKIGKKGSYVYLVMLDTSANKKAITAINKAL